MKPSASRTSELSSSWSQEMRQAITTTSQLEAFLEQEIPHTQYPIFIPLNFAKKIKESGIGSPLWNQFVPSLLENNPQGLEDPIADHEYSKGNGIIHRYENRILFSPTEVCPIQCRYCFRKNELHQQDEIFRAKTNALCDYLIKNPHVEEVIFTGGDPLILSNSKFESYLETLSQIKTIKLIRFHTRTPVILPERIDSSFMKLMEKFSRRFDLISLVIHTNHTSEWSPLFLKKLQILRKTNLNLLSQSVLLKGVNDDPEDLALLYKMLVINGVTPYYLHHPDPVKGATHFQIELRKGREIYHQLKQRVSGFMLPHYVVELPEGSGKALAFNSQNFNASGKWIGKEGEWTNGPES